MVSRGVLMCLCGISVLSGLNLVILGVFSPHHVVESAINTGAHVVCGNLKKNQIEN